MTQNGIFALKYFCLWLNNSDYVPITISLKQRQRHGLSPNTGLRTRIRPHPDGRIRIRDWFSWWTDSDPVQLPSDPPYVNYIDFYIDRKVKGEFWGLI